MQLRSFFSMSRCFFAHLGEAKQGSSPSRPLQPPEIRCNGQLLQESPVMRVSDFLTFWASGRCEVWFYGLRMCIVFAQGVNPSQPSSSEEGTDIASTVPTCSDSQRSPDNCRVTSLSSST